MKKLLTILPILAYCVTANASPTALSDYSQVVNALKHGNIVRAIYTLDHCKLASTKTYGNAKLEDATGDFIGIDFTIFSNTHFDMNGKSKNGVVTSLTEISKFEKYNYRSYTAKAFDDNSAELTMTVAKPQTGEVIKSSSFVCSMGKDSDQSGVVFYTVS